MPIQPSDLVLRYSVTTASAGNTVAGSAAGSLGKYISTTPIPNNQLNNLFTDISGDDNANFNIDYRCVFIENQNAQSLTLQNARIWVTNQVVGGATVLIGVDPTPVSLIGSVQPQAVTLSNLQTALTSMSPGGSSTINVSSAPNNNSTVSIGLNNNVETKTIIAVNGNILTLATPLDFNHSVGEVVVSTRPDQVTFPSTGNSPDQQSTAVSRFTGLNLGDIPAGSCKAFWYQRLAENSAALDNDALSIRIDGDTTE